MAQVGRSKGDTKQIYKSYQHKSVNNELIFFSNSVQINLISIRWYRLIELLQRHITNVTIRLHESYARRVAARCARAVVWNDVVNTSCTLRVRRFRCTNAEMRRLSNVFLHMRLTIYVHNRLDAIATNRWLLTNETRRDEAIRTSLTMTARLSVCTRIRTGTSGRVRFSYIKKVGKKI